MKNIILSTVFICTFLSGIDHKVFAQHATPQNNIHPTDKAIAERILTQFKGDNHLKTNLLIVKVGMFLQETPYVANTLENGKEEQMVVNLRELDCTTFVENCLALALTIQKKETNYNDFVDELRFIRYRDGVLNEYPSRLHYFTDWIFNNSKKALLKNISKEMGCTIFPNKVNFMSTHFSSYPALNNSPNFVNEIALQETEINRRDAYYIPKKILPKYEHLLQDGDILGITTNISGLDISHVVIVIHKKGKIHILHASQLHKKVLVSNETLQYYLDNQKSVTGIMVARPL